MRRCISELDDALSSVKLKLTTAELLIERDGLTLHIDHYSMPPHRLIHENKHQLY